MTDAAPVAILVEDERQIRRFVRTALETEGWSVFEAETLKQGLVEAGTRRPDVVIRDLRTWSAIPVIVLSARVHETDKIEALDAGADDFLTKPFGVGELLARVRAVLRRKVAAATRQPIFCFGDVEVDLTKRVVRKRSVEVHLTAIEYRLLSTMISNAEKVVTNRQILREVWGPAYVEHQHYVRVHMSHLRRKLEDDSTQPKHLLTETAVGYRLVA